MLTCGMVGWIFIASWVEGHTSVLQERAVGDVYNGVLNQYCPSLRPLTTLEGGVTDVDGGVHDCENSVTVSVDVAEETIDQAHSLPLDL